MQLNCYVFGEQEGIGPVLVHCKVIHHLFDILGGYLAEHVVVVDASCDEGCCERTGGIRRQASHEQDSFLHLRVNLVDSFRIVRRRLRLVVIRFLCCSARCHCLVRSGRNCGRRPLESTT